MRQVAAGYMTDSFRSKKTPFLIGMATMLASSLLFFLGTNIAVIVAARVAQGFSASLIWVSGLAFLSSHVKATRIGVAMGYISIGMAAGELAGPVVGGLLYEKAGHFSVMALVLGVLGVDILLRILLTDKPNKPEQSTDSSAEESRPLLGEHGGTNVNAEPQDSYKATQTRSASSDGKCLMGSRSGDVEVVELNKPNLTTESDSSIILVDKDLRDLCASFFASSIVAILRFSLESVST